MLWMKMGALIWSLLCFLFKYRCLSQLPGFDAAVCFDVFREIVLEGEDAWLRLTGAIKREDIPHALFLEDKKKKKQCGIEFGLNYTLCNKWVCHNVCYNSVFQLFGSRDWSFSSDLFGLTIIFDTDIHFPDKMTLVILLLFILCHQQISVYLSSETYGWIDTCFGSVDTRGSKKMKTGDVRDLFKSCHPHAKNVICPTLFL